MIYKCFESLHLSVKLLCFKNALITQVRLKVMKGAVFKKYRDRWQQHLRHTSVITIVYRLYSKCSGHKLMDNAYIQTMSAHRSEPVENKTRRGNRNNQTITTIRRRAMIIYMANSVSVCRVYLQHTDKKQSKAGEIKTMQATCAGVPLNCKKIIRPNIVAYHHPPDSHDKSAKSQQVA